MPGVERSAGAAPGGEPVAVRRWPLLTHLPARGRTIGLSLATLLLLLGAAAPGHAQLRSGATAPLFTAPAALAGHEFSFSLGEALKKGPVVLYFYPQAFTAGCSQEAHDFAEAQERFAALGAMVVGVSGDAIATLDRFSVSECNSRFPVVADADRAVMKAYDSVLIPLTSYASRTSYVITPDDRILYAYDAMSPENHVAYTLAALSAWRAQHKPVAH